MLAGPIVTVLLVPGVIRSVTRMSLTEWGGGATMKSALLTAVPFAVVTRTFPDVAEAGTVVLNDVVEADPIAGGVALNSRWLREDAASKFVPVMVTAVPATPLAGDTLEIVGAADATTVSEVALDALPEGVVAEISPVVAEGGTVVTIWVVVELVTVAVTPLNVTVF